MIELIHFKFIYMFAETYLAQKGLRKLSKKIKYDK